MIKAGHTPLIRVLGLVAPCQARCRRSGTVSRTTCGNASPPRIWSGCSRRAWNAVIPGAIEANGTSSPFENASCPSAYAPAPDSEDKLAQTDADHPSDTRGGPDRRSRSRCLT
jgi:hypothetical protein